MSGQEESDADPDDVPRAATVILPPAAEASLVLITPETSQLQVEATPGWLCIMKSREERRELLN